jgi:DNA replication initiation complex subunit (GINS family)
MNKIVISKATREELLEARSALMAQLTGMQERQLTPEEQSAFDALVAQVNEIDAKVTTLEAEMMVDPAADPGEGHLPVTDR